MSGRKAGILVGLIALATVALVWFWWFRAPPQIGSDENVRKTVDALYTAVTARDPKRLEDSAKRLQTLRESGKLPPDAAAYLEGIVHTAQAGRWESAAQRLWQFIYEQRGS